MNYPLTFRFKIVAIAPQIHVTDAAGATVCYVKQKLFKLKENIVVYADEAQSQIVCEIKADRVIDWSGNYSFFSPDGQEFGNVKRQGLKSLFSARYDIERGGGTLFELREENPWIKFLDGLFESIPVLGILSGYLFHPRYTVSTPDGRRHFTLHKRPAFLEGVFELEQHQETDADLVILMSVLMMLFLERQRG
jgi:uncharacterized protein YxjI